jgi:hypothetical protein
MSDEQLERRNEPERLIAKTVERDYGHSRRIRVSELFADEFDVVKQSVLEKGFFENKGTGKKLHVQTRTIEGVDPKVDREIVAIAAVSRDPGLTQDYIDLITDYQDKSSGNRPRTIRQYWNIYKQEGIVNNAINKYAALLSVGGRFNVRNVKKGKQQKAVESAEEILDFFNRNVNAPSDTGIATASRGVKALTEQGIRIALVEGDFMGREVWGTHDVGTLGKFSLPMTIQTLSMEFMEAVPELGGLGEFWWWRPGQAMAKLIKGEVTNLPKPAKDIVKKLFENDLVKQIKKDGRALLDPALLLHVKHRGSDRDLFGESFIEPAKIGIRFIDAVNKADMVSMESVINRLLIVMVGSSDPKSPYSQTDVAAARASLMQSFFDDTGPTMTIVWQGDDVKIENVSAMDAMLDLSERHTIGERKVVVALGIPAALLDGSSALGAAAGWASLIAASGMAEHLGGAFARIWTELGIRILLENGFVDIDIEYQYDRTNLVDKDQERNQNRNDYTAGLCSIRSAIATTGRDPDVEFQQRCFEKGLDPTSATWEQVFMPPQGLAGQGAGGNAPIGLPGGPNPHDPNGQPLGPDGKPLPGHPGGTNPQIVDPNAPPGTPGAPPPGQGPGKPPGNGRTPNKVKGKPTQKKGPNTTGK